MPRPCWLLLLLLLVVPLGAYAQDDEAIEDVPEAEALHAALREHFMAGELDEAMALAERLLALRREAFGPRHPQVTASLSDLATLRSRSGDLEGAERTYTEALALRADLLGEDHPDVGHLHTLRSTTRYRLGRMDAAMEDLRAARERVPETDRRYPGILQNTGAILLLRGDGEEAVALLGEAYHLRRAADGPDAPSVLRMQTKWTEAVLAYRPLVEGCAAAEDAVRAKRAAYEDGHPEVMASLVVRASCHRRRGALEAAEADLREAATLVTGDFGLREDLEAERAELELLQNDPEAALTRIRAALADLTSVEAPIRRARLQTVHGRALLAAGQPTEAVDVLTEAHAVLLEEPGPRSPLTLSTAKHLGRARRAAGDPRGLDLLREAHEGALAHGGVLAADAPWPDLAAARLADGDVGGALDLLARGEEASIAYYGAANPATLLARVPRVEGLVRAGRLDEAREPLQRCVSLFTAWLGQNRVGKSHRQTLALAALGRRLQDLVLAVLDRPGDDARAWRLVMALKGSARRSLDAVARDRRRSEADQALWQRLSEARRERARAALEGRDQTALRATIGELEQALSAAAARDLDPPPTARVLQDALPRRVGLVDLVEVGGEAPRLIAFVATRETLARVDLGPSEVIEGRARRFLLALQATGVPPGLVRSARDDLHALVVEPFVEPLPPIDALWLVPDGALARLPIAALPGFDREYLVEDLVLRMLEDPRDVLATRPEAWGEGALVVGDVTYTEGAWDPCSPGPFPALPGTAREAALVGETLGATPLTGEAPTVEAVRAALPGRRVVHLATHGFYADRCEAAEASEALALSGVALAGPGGVLTGVDLLDLDLTGTELVTLSACDTGSGAVQVGEGILGLRWALHRAGAHGLLIAMYRVPDEPTVALMRLFYRSWRPGRDAAVSLARAQRRMIRRQRRSGEVRPGDWAGFVVSGAP